MLSAEQELQSRLDSLASAVNPSLRLVNKFTSVRWRVLQVFDSAAEISTVLTGPWNFERTQGLPKDFPTLEEILIDEISDAILADSGIEWSFEASGRDA